MAKSTVNNYSWTYKDTNITPDLVQNYTRSDRVVLYVKPDNDPKAQFRAVGFIQGLSVDEQKQLSLMYELGSSAPMIIPGLTQGQMSLQRVLLNGIDFLNTVYSGDPGAVVPQNQIIRSIRDVDTPFSIIIAKYSIAAEGERVNSSDAENKAVQSVLYTGCQIQSKNESLQAGGVVSMENVMIMFTHIPQVEIKAYK